MDIYIAANVERQCFLDFLVIPDLCFPARLMRSLPCYYGSLKFRILKELA